MKSTLGREFNAITAIAAREVARALKSPAQIGFSLVFPIIFLGILGGSLAQNLGAGLGFNYLQFVFIGLVVNTLYQTTISGVIELIEERETDFTQEMFVAPVSRYALIVGKIVGCSITSLFQLVGLFLIAVILRVPFGGLDVVRILLLAPILCLAGGALGVCFIGFVRDPKVAGVGALLLVFPQMFLAGVLIPVNHSSGLLAVLTYLMPLTYLVDLARATFYWGTAEYNHIVVYSPAFDLLVTTAFFLVFSVVGTTFFTRAERNR